MTALPPYGLHRDGDGLNRSRLSQVPERTLAVSSVAQEAATGDLPTRDLSGTFEVSSAKGAYNDRSHGVVHDVLFQEGLGSQTYGDPQNPPLVPEDACATIDTGCQRMAIGYDTLQKLAQHIPDELSVNLIPQVQNFRSVHGRSSTTHVASIPTSVGPKGSLLRPAVFENEESRKAPFLISLPFLMFCRTVLYLDPQTGVKDHCWKLGFTVACHLGPTGALRIPLCEFDEIKRNKVHQAQQRFCEQSGEFEVLKVQENSPTGELPQSGVSSSHGAAVFETQQGNHGHYTQPNGPMEEADPQGDVSATHYEHPDLQPDPQEGGLRGHRGVRDDLTALVPELQSTWNLEGPGTQQPGSLSAVSSHSELPISDKEKPQHVMCTQPTRLPSCYRIHWWILGQWSELTSPPICECREM